VRGGRGDTAEPDPDRPLRGSAPHATGAGARSRRPGAGGGDRRLRQRGAPHRHRVLGAGGCPRDGARAHVARPGAPLLVDGCLPRPPGGEPLPAAERPPATAPFPAGAVPHLRAAAPARAPLSTRRAPSGAPEGRRSRAIFRPPPTPRCGLAPQIRYKATTMDGGHETNRAYYDEFSKQYEAHRGDNAPRGYHNLLDSLESEYVRRFGEGREVLEVGCGTGLVLERIARFASKAKGIDLSPGMLEKARARGLDVVEGSATDLPFAEESFDVTCSLKVLADVRDIERGLSGMARVTRVGGVVLAELYNPWSLRGLLRRLGPAQKVGEGTRESDVYTRFDSPR